MSVQDQDDPFNLLVTTLHNNFCIFEKEKCFLYQHRY